MFKEINLNQPLYDPKAVQPMRDELIYVGFEEMTTPQKVEQILSKNDNQTILVVINSVCGCAAGSARPGVSLALQNEIIPDKLTTVFAGQDRQAVEFLRSNYLKEYSPSSPSIALLKNEKVLYFMRRQDIEGKSPEEVAEELKNAFNKFCKRKGPSISKENFEKLVHAKVCGSKIPLINSN